MQIIVGVLALLAALWFWWIKPPVEQWVDIAKSHTGQEIPIQREVEFNFGSGELSNAFRRWPNRFSIEFTNPIDGRRISWKGSENIRPVLLDVVNGTAWLVLNSPFVYSDKEKYGCPAIDYVFLKWDKSEKEWNPVDPSKAPQELREANLSFGYEAYLMMNSRVVSAEQISLSARSTEISTSGHFNRLIPRSFDQWKYQYKKVVRRLEFRTIADLHLPNQ